ncbi:thymidylate kinase [Ammonifex degensii KC4]|uniref:Thymidylate kinase n=1 Tax=Ammonifex degensii (strain DSM 10501 / KC4) TaxID=429009 RepID=C9RA68_AMMDK|nr:dTMP kinase [Ammonifex degensii]ACX53197.1 thymidylate kinase [Ammonifex degensii KC4]
MRGFFIVLEGIDGVGKTTQARILAQKLREQGREVVEVREPGGTRLGEAIRELLQKEELAPWAEACLFLASRAQLVEEVIKPALAKGKVVVGDRFSLSTLAYQGALGLEPDKLAQLNSWVTGGLEPDLTLVIDLKAEEALARGKGDLREEIRQKLEIVRERYLNLAKERAAKVLVVDGQGSVEEVSRRIWALVEEALARWSSG